MANPWKRRIATLGATGAARQKGVAESEREYEFADLKGDLDQIGELAGRPRVERGHGCDASLGRMRRGRASFDLRRNAGYVSGRRIWRRGRTRTARRRAVQDSPERFSGGAFARSFLCGLPSRAGGADVPADFALSLGRARLFADAERWHGVRGRAPRPSQRWASRQLPPIEAVDLFRGKNVPAGKFSLLVRVTFQSLEGTLTEAEVNEFSARIVAALEQQLGATLRAS